MKLFASLAFALVTVTVTASGASAAGPQSRAMCKGEFNTGSGMAGSRIGDEDGKSCFADADTAQERAIQKVCSSGSNCEVIAMVTKFRNGNMQIVKVLSVKKGG